MKTNIRSIHPINDVIDYLEYLPEAVVYDEEASLNMLEQEAEKLEKRLQEIRDKQHSLRATVYDKVAKYFSQKDIDNARRAYAKKINGR